MWMSDISWQVIAPLLIIKRVANQSALTSTSVVTGGVGSFSFRSRGGAAGGSGTLPGGYPMNSGGSFGKGSKELNVGVETTIDFHQDTKV